MDIPEEKIIKVRAKEQNVDGTDFIIPAIGLEELFKLTNEFIPEGAKNAFAAVQKVNLKFKILKCQGVIAANAALATGLGAVPILFSDCFLIPVQIEMLALISYFFDLKLYNEFLGSIISSVSGGSLTIFGGTKLSSKLMQFFKAIPGVGIIADVITGATSFV